MDLSLPYVAGLFDGEGCVGLYEGQLHGWNFRVQLIQNESREALSLWTAMCERWGGHISHSRSANGHSKMNWQLGQARAAEFLREIQPWIILKAEQVEIALAWLDARPPLRRDPATGRKLARAAEDQLATRVAAYKLKRLKRQDDPLTSNAEGR